MRVHIVDCIFCSHSLSKGAQEEGHFDAFCSGTNKKRSQRRSEKEMWASYWTTHSSRLPGFCPSCCIPFLPFFLTWPRPRHTIGKNSIATQLPREVNLTDPSVQKSLNQWVHILIIIRQVCLQSPLNSELWVSFCFDSHHSSLCVEYSQLHHV